MSKKYIHNKNKIVYILSFVFVFLAGIFTVYAISNVFTSIRYLAGTGGNPHITGTFSSTGNAGILSFAERPIDGFSGAHLFVPASGQQFLTGSFWSQTIGWIELHDIEMNLTSAAQNMWSLSGNGWSQYAGWIDFSTITYHLSNTSFSGYAWSENIGWLDMNDASLDLTSLGAIGKVKILGIISGKDVYSTIYDSNVAVSTAKSNQILNGVRKNASLLTRNIPNDKINTTIDGTSRAFSHGGWLRTLNNTLIFKNDDPIATARVNYTTSIRDSFINTFGSTPIYSAIVIGADIYIDDAVLPQNDGRPRVLIALKNESGIWGNIYIDGWITQIKSTLVAEWSLYSWEFTGSIPAIYNNDASQLFKIPNRQLYIKWSVIANNTIGGYGVDNKKQNYCPYNIECTDSTALTFDFNHFRDFQESADESVKAPLRGYIHPTDSSLNNIYDAYSLVIEHDPRILSSPPPWLEDIR